MHLSCSVWVQISVRFNQGFSICSTTHFPRRGNMSLLLIVFGSTRWYRWLERGSWLWRFQSNCEYLDFQDSPRCEGDPLDRFCCCLLVDTMSWYPHTVIFLLLRVPHSIIAHHWFDPPKGYVLGWVVQSVQRSLRTGWQQECFSCPPQISVLISQWPYTLPDEHDLFSYRLLNRLPRWFDLHYSYVSYDGLLGNILNTSGKNTHETHRLSWFVHHNHPQTNVLLG